MFFSGGNSQWAQLVRGCLVCMFNRGYSQSEAHEYCYRRATHVVGQVAAIDALNEAVAAAIHCLLIDFWLSWADDLAAGDWRL